MKLVIDSDTLSRRLQLAARALSTRTGIQALAGIVIEPDGDSAVLKATDMEIALRVPLEARVDNGEQILVPGRLLLDVVRALPSGEVTLETGPDGRELEIAAGSAQFRLRTLSADDFPRLPDPAADPILLPAAEFVDTIDRVARAASRDEARPILTGIHVISEGTSLTMVATDSYRLAVKTTELDSEPAGSLEATIPARALRELSRLVGQEGADEVRVSMLGNQVVFEAGGCLLSSRLIEGQFPNYRQLLPENYEHELRLPREELVEVVRRISLLAQKNAPLRLALSEGELTVSAETPDIGEARESVPVGFSGEPMEIGFNPEFLREGIESVQADELALQLISSLRPGLLSGVGVEDYRYLVMPIRLNV
ncbi:MAG: DNA polymerase III subunit beta [Solirubrobacterales bacterium]